MINSGVNYGTVSIPKSSLEAVKSQIESDLQSATQQKNLKLIKKYQAELDQVQAKIKNFERDWLGYKKRKLETHLNQTKTPKDLPAATTSASQAEISEIETLLKNYK
ncbi:MAG TPA: hypothetical protein VJJ81_03975 [Candidatus Babeliales bacterium]|nr:hypothetical protein [Candidatus Babeliales bacterium]